jgi:L,D-peptidoglycan transpeptidase YkuD (ErfK/YbiS/YcfS/YnhG family)
MLTRGSGPGRAASGHRRRPFLLLSLLLAALALAAADLHPPRKHDLATTRRVARLAQRTAIREVPEAEPRLGALSDLADEITQRELSSPFWRRNDDALEAAWGRLIAAATEAQAGVQRLQRGDNLEWREIERQAASAVDAAQREARTPGLGRVEAKLAAQAIISLDHARRLAAGSAWEEAGEAARSAVEHAGRVHAGWVALHSRFTDRTWLRRWQSMADDTISESIRRRTTGLVVDKYRRRLTVYRRGRPIARFPAELGVGGLRQKLHAGDGATPEGRYRVTDVKLGARTRYYKALLVDYPNSEDLARWQKARTDGSISRRVGVGGLIEIHGHGGQGTDWTDGCVALLDRDMDRLLEYAGLGTPVTIVGTVPRDSND